MMIELDLKIKCSDVLQKLSITSFNADSFLVIQSFEFC